MRHPTYLSKFTLKDYIAGLVRKDSEDQDNSNSYSLSAEARPFLPLKTSLSAEASPFPTLKSSLSAEAKPFLPLKTFSILVSSLESNISFTIPVFSNSLSVSTLRQYFPLATNMNYIQNGQMITVATSKNYNTEMNTDTELTELKFCIPDSCHQYFVSEHGEVEVDRHRLCKTTMEDTAKCVEGIKHRLKSTMAEVKKLEEEVSELLKLFNDEAGETFLKMNNMVNLQNNEFAYCINQNIEAVNAYTNGDDVELVHTSSEHAVGIRCSLGLKEFELYDTSPAEKELAVKEEVAASDDLVVEEKKYFEDYGFSDTDSDDAIDVVTCKDVDCKEVKEDNRCNVEVEKSNLSSSPLDAFSVPLFKSESCSLSSRPRCVRRVVGK